MLRFLCFVKLAAVALLTVILARAVHSQDDNELPDDTLGRQASTDIQQESSEMMQEDRSRWPYFSAIAIPPVDAATVSDAPLQLVDFFVTPEIFWHAAADLSDLRIYTADGSTIPYALRILAARSVRDVIPAAEFNRSEPDDGIHELTLDLQRDDIEHNEIQVETTGTDYRRSVVISGSSDAKDWKPLASGFVIQWTSDQQALLQQTFTYPNSRHQYLRVQVTPDPQIAEGRDEFTFQSVSVLRQLDVPGKLVTTEATVSSREPTRYYGTPGSRWILDFGSLVPCERLEVVVADDEFARDVTLEAESLSETGQSVFYPLSVNETTAWRRLRGEPSVPMVLTFSEILSRRLRLTVADYRNKPLTLSSVRGIAAARQIVFERPDASKLPLKLYFGNHEAETANYDFSRNLPDVLTADPGRASISEPEASPEYVPPPVAFTERFPWLIYVALSIASLVLGAVTLNVSKAAITMHDHEKASTPS